MFQFQELDIFTYRPLIIQQDRVCKWELLLQSPLRINKTRFGCNMYIRICSKKTNMTSIGMVLNLKLICFANKKDLPKLIFLNKYKKLDVLDDSWHPRSTLKIKFWSLLFTTKLLYAKLLNRSHAKMGDLLIRKKRIYVQYISIDSNLEYNPNLKRQSERPT